MKVIAIATGILGAAALVMADGKGAAAKKAMGLEEGKKIFEANCVVCHGASGKGDGAAAAAMTPMPRDFTDAAYMQTRPVDQLRKVISEGGQSAGLSPLMMPFNSSLDAGQIDAVLNYVIAFSKSGGAKKPK